MAETKWIEHKGKKIFLMDFSNSEINDVIAAIEKAKSIIAAEPANSVLGIVDVTGGGFDRPLTDALKNFANHNKPFMKMSAVVGVSGIKKVVYQGVLVFTGRKNLVLKDTVDDAKDWLVEQ